MVNLLIIVAFFIPIVSAVVCAVFSRTLHKLIIQIFSLSTVIFLTGVSLYSFFSFKSSYVIKLMPWLYLGNLHVDWAINIDRLTLLMFVVVSVVSLVVRIYSFEYMKDDPGKLRFFSYLSLFAFAMMILVSSTNFLQLFLGWEGVGVCSYLLIGFWFKKENANNAAIKAFIVNRVGDAFLIIGISAVYFTFHTLNFSQIFSQIDLYKNVKILGFDAINFICFNLFLGCMGKSAQIGFHVWLPDAMEGPTPVSALIHAATMVTAGIFLIVRASPLFQLAVNVNEFIIIVGAVTSIFAASIALFADDIKKIIAYSTCSQLGYMVVACGAGAYNVAMFHLVTHAFFKALLFLSAGSVIHAMHGEQDIYRMEPNLWKKIPITYLMFWIGSLALSGIFPFAGFYSKDLIIESVYNVNFIFSITLFVTILTSMYSWRLIIIAFHAKEKPFSLPVKVHESSFIMLFPLCVLALLSVFSGVFLEYFLHIVSQEFWGDSIIVTILPDVPFGKKLMPSVCAVLGIISIFVLKPLFLIKSCCPKKNNLIVLGILFSFVLCYISFYLFFLSCILFFIAIKDDKLIFLNLLKNKYYVDEIYQKFFIVQLKKLSAFFWIKCDIKTIDLVPNCVANFTQIFSGKLLKLHNGYIYNSVFIILFGLVIFLSLATLKYLL